MRKLMMSAMMMAITIGSAVAATIGSNLVANGSFDNPENPLTAWMYKYEREGDSWYFNNHNNVKVVDDGSHKSVLALWGNYSILQAPGQGTKVDSQPIPFEAGVTYELSAWGRSSGPTSRMLIEGYRWDPGVKPHPDPDIYELRKCYKFSQLYFGPKKEGSLGDVPKTWSQGKIIFPDPEMSKSPDAKKNLAKIKFVVIHIVAIGGADGTLYVDDISIKKLAK
jgi:hypothetical protein